MRIDLHVHSCFSKRPSQWFLKKIGCPESFTDPTHLYRIAKARGMSMVTITDHNRIDGALAIAHLPDVFISEEITAYFPQDRCKVHILALNISEAQHAEIRRLRENIFELTAFLRQQGITHVLAHPLYPVNELWSLEHFEQLLLLFRTFELNGARNDESNVVLTRILASLKPEDIHRLAEKHRIDPPMPEPWRKTITAGSDDHSCLNIARSFTEVRGAKFIEDFLAGIEHGDSQAHRNPSTPRTMAHNLYGIAYQFYCDRFKLDRYANKDRLFGFLDRMLCAPFNTLPKIGWTARIYGFWRQRRAPESEAMAADSLMALLSRETLKVIGEHPRLAALTDAETLPEDKDMHWWELVNDVSNRAFSRVAGHLMGHFSGANVFDIFQTVGSAGCLYTLMAPYFVAYNAFSSDRRRNRLMLSRFGSKPGPSNPAVAHFTDTFNNVNGVATTLRQQTQTAVSANRNYTLITCEPHHTDVEGVCNFTPVGEFDLPEYPEQKLYYPPFLEMLEFCYRQRISHIQCATPGPVGLAGLAIAKILDLPIAGTYHTQLPQYARHLTGDSAMEELTWKYTLWYYDQMDIVYAPSEATRAELMARGIRPEKIRCYPRGIDVKRFHPNRRNGYLQKHFNIGQGLKFLYVGRVSREKNLHLLAEAFRRMTVRRAGLHLVVVGEGPYLNIMRQQLNGTPVTFTGYLTGDDLAAVYASCDVFVFPSATDTFGNVVLEAQSSGLPVIVTDAGGPSENMLPDETGLVVAAGDLDGLQTAMEILASDSAAMRRMGQSARRLMEARSFQQSFEQAWDLFQESETSPGSPTS